MQHEQADFGASFAAEVSAVWPLYPWSEPFPLGILHRVMDTG